MSYWVKLKKRSDSCANKPNYSLLDSSDALNYVNKLCSLYLCLKRTCFLYVTFNSGDPGVRLHVDSNL